ncbi:MAG: hypothetical protein FWH24_01740 [Oscillospiraceae bacterium]|nr:hypothetical protein [Oscillospiraceae bacterium]
MDIKDVLFKEIDLIQDCIKRMANNSFFIKGWLITLFAVALALIPESIDIRPVCIVGLVVISCFWYLDAFFLKMERLYRWKYEWVIKNRNASNDEFYFDLNPYNEKMWLPNKEGKCKKQPFIVSIMFSKTLIPLYVLLIMAILVVLLNTFFSWI